MLGDLGLCAVVVGRTVVITQHLLLTCCRLCCQPATCVHMLTCLARAVCIPCLHGKIEDDFSFGSKVAVGTADDLDG